MPRIGVISTARRGSGKYIAKDWNTNSCTVCTLDVRQVMAKVVVFPADSMFWTLREAARTSRLRSEATREATSDDILKARDSATAKRKVMPRRITPSSTMYSTP